MHFKAIEEITWLSVRKLRQANLGLSQKKFWEKYGINPGSACRIENGTQPIPPSVITLIFQEYGPQDSVKAKLAQAQELISSALASI